MKGIIFIFALILSFHLSAQKADSVGILSKLKGQGSCIRKGKIASLKIPYYFLYGDQVKIQNGDALVILFNKEEVPLKSGESYTFAFNKMDEKRNREMLMYYDSKQSNVSYAMRGDIDTNIVLFPIRSNLIHPSNALIQVKSDSSDFSYTFRLNDPEIGEDLFRIEDSDKESINLEKVNFEKGKTYRWNIKGNGTGAIGEIKVLTKDQLKKMQKFKLKSRASYINAFNYYCKEKCFFDAWQTIEKAIKQYPEDEFFVYLKKTIFDK